jgi:hypothetical protein
VRVGAAACVVAVLSATPSGAEPSVGAGAAEVDAAFVHAAPPRVDARALVTLVDDAAQVELDLTIALTLGATVASVPVWLPAERLRAEPRVTQPSELRELFPHHATVGGYEALEVEVDRRPCRVLARGDDWLRCAAPASRRFPVTIRTRLVVPERYGSLGRVGGSVTLGGGWLPRVDPLDAPPAPIALTLDVAWPGALHALVGEAWRPSVGDGAPRRERFGPLAAEPPLVLRPASWAPTRLADGRVVAVASTRERIGRDALDRPWLRELGRGLGALLDHRAARGMRERRGRRGRPLVVVEAPLRHGLAEVADGVLFVSDRAFRMVDVDRFLRFHQLALLAEAIVALELADAGAPGPRRLEADVRATLALEPFVRDAFGGRESAFDVLGWVAFIPSIDAMLYAPDLPFAEAYFRGARPDDPLLPDLVDAPFPPRRGRLLTTKLIARLGEPGARALEARLTAGEPALDALRTVAGARFVETWLGPTPRARHALGAVRTAPTAAGRVAVEVEVERVGQATGEPIEVALRDARGARTVVTTGPDPGPRTTLTATLAAPLDVVELDPSGHLADTPDAAAPSPRVDHRDPARWKVLLNNFNVLLAASEGAIQTALDLSASRIWDVRWSFGARAEYAQDAISGLARATYGFGPLVTPARLAGFATAYVEGGYLRAGFGGAPSAGGALATGLTVGWDDRWSIWAAESGTSLRLNAQLASRLGEPGPGVDPHALSVSARLTRQWRLGVHQQLTARLTAATTLFGRPERQLLFGLGGRAGVRGYALDAELGRHRATAHLEWLHPVAPRLELNGFFLAWVTGVEGAAFVDAGVVGDTLDEAFGGPVFADVGYGLRFLIDYLGVRPGIMAIEVAFPLVRARGAATLGPPAVYVAFSQTFAGL